MKNVDEGKVDNEESADFASLGKRKRDSSPEMKINDEQKVKLKKLCKQLLRQVQNANCYLYEKYDCFLHLLVYSLTN